MDPRLAKLVVKGALGVAVSTVIGFMIKAEHHVDDRIDEHYDKKKQEDQNK